MLASRDDPHNRIEGADHELPPGDDARPVEGNGRDRDEQHGGRREDRDPDSSARGGHGGIEVNKKERYDASKVLVDALTSEYLHIRRTAIECLKKIYRNEGRFYRADAHKKDRADKQKKWRTFIRKEYRGR